MVTSLKKKSRSRRIDFSVLTYGLLAENRIDKSVGSKTGSGIGLGFSSADFTKSGAFVVLVACKIIGSIVEHVFGEFLAHESLGEGFFIGIDIVDVGLDATGGNGIHRSEVVGVFARDADFDFFDDLVFNFGLDGDAIDARPRHIDGETIVDGRIRRALEARGSDGSGIGSGFEVVFIEIIRNFVNDVRVDGITLDKMGDRSGENGDFSSGICLCGVSDDGVDGSEIAFFGIDSHGFQGIGDGIVGFAEDELLPLPGLHGLKYFEVEMRSFATESMRFEATLYVGLVEQPRTSTEVPPGMASRSIGISTEDHTVSVDGTSEWSFPQELTSGCILGLGVQETGSILITLNGKRLNTNLLSTPNFKRFIPAVATEGCASECLINLGQRPFAFPDARPPNGWCYYTRLAPDQCLFRKGSPNGYHLLHFFPFGSPGHRTADSHVVARELRENERYELTALKTGGDDLFGIGLSDCDFAMGNMVGWDQRTLGIHSDDGMLFRENGGGSRQVIDSGNLKDGETIGLLYDRHVVKAYRNGRVSDVVDDWLMKPYPTFSITGSFIVIANFGEMPFVSDGGSDDPKGVTLYNGRQVTVTNERSEEVGLCIGDRVEARDLSFRGTYVGEFNGYFLFMVKGLDTVIPFEETDPLLVRRMIRVVARPKQAPITQFGLTSNAVVLYTNKSAKNEYGSLCATPYGISMMIGRNNDSYVMRPIVDLVNNAPLFTIPISCQLCRLFEPGQMSRFRSSDILPLDVVESSDPGTRLVLLLGNGLGWNGSKLAPFKGKHRVYFRFFGLGFRRIQVHPTYIVNHGTRAGGQGYLPYYRGTEGTAFFQSSVTQRSYGSKGLTPVPGVALYLLRTLNEHLLKTASVTPPPSDPPSDMSEWCYDPELDQQSRHIDVPLVTESHYP